ncbi:high affinity copper uptake protein 1-like isoform X2 [Achroia grisella]|nr:high affinity copper uptake protein 1-like isoform X2 [Achroia grisella]XP_059047446.1 high affinity copper uptake protein 1-like isoform X2 [Achroia grisella]
MDRTHMDHSNMHMDHKMNHGDDHMGHHLMNLTHSNTNLYNDSADISPMSHHQSDVVSQSSHENHGSVSHSMMSMTFHGGYIETILFSWWNVEEVGEFVGSFFAIFIMALLYEGLKYYRKHLLWKSYTGLQYCAVSPPDKGVANICAADEPQVIQPMPHVLERNVPTMLSKAHAWQTVLHGIQVLVSYMLMLVFMTYNTWLCAAVVLGSATGYFFFGWRESVVVDFTEHCH